MEAPTMSQDNVTDMTQPREPPPRLRRALSKARLNEVERSDVIVDLREAEIARLELLQEALADVFESIPPDSDLLECALIPGSPPRLWIDVLAYVCMGRDKRTYRFVKDTRYGRQVILETTELEEMAERVTDYVAHRLIERQRALESDGDRQAAGASKEALAHTTGKPPTRRFGWAAVAVAFVLGLLIGAIVLFAGALLVISS
jgi:hypothetical protein